MTTFEEQYKKYSASGQEQSVSIICDRREK